ncbi:MAG: hypothetical protein J3K34DRAFT_493710 [Monoraphidium minutum]|nr:MAG: hypothetical protein J3K34DRAFT_493710 [Monoraphidium minutum]
MRAGLALCVLVICSQSSGKMGCTTPTGPGSSANGSPLISTRAPARNLAVGMADRALNHLPHASGRCSAAPWGPRAAARRLAQAPPAAAAAAPVSAPPVAPAAAAAAEAPLVADGLPAEPAAPAPQPAAAAPAVAHEPQRPPPLFVMPPPRPWPPTADPGTEEAVPGLAPTDGLALNASSLSLERLWPLLASAPAALSPVARAVAARLGAPGGGGGGGGGGAAAAGLAARGGAPRASMTVLVPSPEALARLPLQLAATDAGSEAKRAVAARLLPLLGSRAADDSARISRITELVYRNMVLTRYVPYQHLSNGTQLTTKLGHPVSVLVSPDGRTKYLRSGNSTARIVVPDGGAVAPLVPVVVSDEFEWWKQQPGDDDYAPPPAAAAAAAATPRAAAFSDDRGGRDRGGGGGRGSRGGGGGAGQRGRRPWEKEEEDDEDDGKGWWELPREERGAAAEAEPLEAWQERRLAVAFAAGRRRASVQGLAAELGIDRSEVTAWFKARAALPKDARDAEEAPLAAEVAAEAAAADARRAAERARRAGGADGADGGGAAGARQARACGGEAAAAPPPPPAPLGSLLAPAKGPDTGFVPFKERAGGGGGAPRRLAADVSRTLESLYSRSPYPSKELLQSACDMLRLPRDVAAEWFVQRRDVDGRPHDPRAAKRLAERAAAASGRGGRRGPMPGEEEELLRVMRAAAAAAAGAAGGAASGAPAPGSRAAREAAAAAAAAAGGGGGPRVVGVTAREMAAIRSSLPSPRKFKGSRLAEELEIRRGGDGAVEIGGVQYVLRSGAAQWRRAWHRRRASRAAGGVPAQRLDFVRWFGAGQRGAGAGAGAGAAGGE